MSLKLNKQHQLVISIRALSTGIRITRFYFASSFLHILQLNFAPLLTAHFSTTLLLNHNIYILNIKNILTFNDILCKSIRDLFES